MDALESLRERRRSHPKDRQTRIELARELRDRAARLEPGDGRALTMLREATEEDPYSLQAWRDLALHLHERGQVSAAHEAYLQALRLVPDDPIALGHHGLLLYECWRAERDRDDLLERALERFEAAHHCDPQGVFPLFGLVDVHLECSGAEVTQTVVRLLQQVPPSVGNAPGFVARALKLALALRRLGPQSGARLESLSQRLFEDWLPLVERCPMLRWLEAMGQVLGASLEDLPEVYARWRDELSPGGLLFVLVRDRLREVSHSAPRTQVVEKMLERRRSDPFLRQEYLALLHLKAKRALALGQIEEAREPWRQAHELDPRNDRVQQNLALAAMALGRENEAQDWWERVERGWIAKAELFPESAAAYEELLGLRAKLEADRLFTRLLRREVAEGEVIAETERWLSRSIQGVVLRGLAADLPEVEPLRGLVEEDLGGFRRFSLRSLLELTDGLLFKPPEKRPPLHYDTLGIDKGAPDSEVSEVVERLLIESGAFQDGNRQDAATTLSDAELRAEYDAATLDWEAHALNHEKARWLVQLNQVLQRSPTKEMIWLVQLVVLTYDFSILREYYESQDPELYAETRDQLIQGYCAKVLNRRFDDPGEALEELSEVAGSLDRWGDANDCCTLARIFNETELIFISRYRRRSPVNGLAKGIYLLKRAEESATNIEARARILQQLAEIETQEPGDIITTASDGDPETKRRLTMALNEIRSRNYDQARMRLESLLKRRPDECGALLMMAKITVEEAGLAWRMTQDRPFLESQLDEAMGLLRRVLDHPVAPQELKGPCKRMVWQINSSLAKARAAEQAAASEAAGGGAP